MTNQNRRSWVEFSDVIAELLSQELGQPVPLGGRFCCADDADDNPMAYLLTARGFMLRDTGQCEMVAVRLVTVSETAIHAFIHEMRELSEKSGYRLVAVEAGDFEEGTALILASEKAYIPWWVNE